MISELSQATIVSFDARKTKNELVEWITDFKNEYRLTQKKVSIIIECAESRVSDIVCKRVDKFSIEWLMYAASKLQRYSISIEA